MKARIQTYLTLTQGQIYIWASMGCSQGTTRLEGPPSSICLYIYILGRRTCAVKVHVSMNAYFILHFPELPSTVLLIASPDNASKTCFSVATTGERFNIAHVGTWDVIACRMHWPAPSPDADTINTCCACCILPPHGHSKSTRTLFLTNVIIIKKPLKPGVMVTQFQACGCLA